MPDLLADLGLKEFGLVKRDSMSRESSFSFSEGEFMRNLTCFLHTPKSLFRGFALPLKYKLCLFLDFAAQASGKLAGCSSPISCL